MRSAQTTSGVDLLVPDTGAGPRERVEEAIRNAIGDGRLAPGARLPSTRALARDLGIARSTVVDAYAQLAAEGWIAAAHGSGTRVAAGVHAAPTPPGPAPDGPEFRHDLRPGRPDLAAFPRAAWTGALRRGLRDAPDAALGYGDPRGLLAVRREIAAYAGRVRGVRTQPEHVVVCAGFSEALAVIGTALRAAGTTTLAMESPCLASHQAIAVASGLRIHPIQVDADGADVEVLATSSAGAVLLTPAHQQPLGVSLSGPRRGWALDWARRLGAVVIEDDYDSEFRFDRAPVGALQGRAPDVVVHVGTVSKTLGPGVRLGWIVVPPRLLDAVVAAKATAGGQHGVLDQLAFAELLRSGAYDRHVRRMRLRYRARRDELVRRLAAEVPEVATSGMAAGLQTLLHLPADWPPATAVVDVAAAHGLGLAALAEHHWMLGDTPTNLLIAGFGTPPQHAFGATLDALLATLAEVRAETRTARRRGCD